MDTDKSIKIIQALANGIDPITGEEFPAESAYQEAQTVRALFEAISALEIVKKSGDKRKNLPCNAGKAWEAEEDQRLISAFDGGKSIKGIAEEHLRTEVAINSRLIMHGKIQR